MLIAKSAKDYRTDFTENNKYPFNHKKDVIDITRLIEKIGNEETSKIKEIAGFLEKEIAIPRPETEPNEVETIMALLEYLSDDENYKEFDGSYECDPEEKINNKFKKYATSFNDEFQNLVPIYGNTRDEAKRVAGLDGVRALKISSYLIRISNRYLREAQNNPQVALDNLTDFFEEKVNSSGICADNGAIKYYLLEELIGCNIFSNELK